MANGSSPSSCLLGWVGFKALAASEQVSAVERTAFLFSAFLCMAEAAVC